MNEEKWVWGGDHLQAGYFDNYLSTAWMLDEWGNNGEERGVVQGKSFTTAVPLLLIDN